MSRPRATELNIGVLSLAYHALYDTVNSEVDREVVGRVVVVARQYLEVFKRTAEQLDSSPRASEFWLKNLSQEVQHQWVHSQRYLQMLDAIAATKVTK